VLQYNRRHSYRELLWLYRRHGGKHRRSEVAGLCALASCRVPRSVMITGQLPSFCAGFSSGSPQGTGAVHESDMADQPGTNVVV
jgi:hypothetical protein